MIPLTNEKAIWHLRGRSKRRLGYGKLLANCIPGAHY
jgi:hypothetical protein